MADSCINTPFQPAAHIRFGNPYNNPDDDSFTAEALPSRFQPKPLSVSQLELLNAAFDPLLIATPERRLPTITTLRRQSSTSPEDDSLNGRATRVHFDQNVAVHHISPERVDSSGSVDDYYIASSDPHILDDFACDELDLTNLSVNEPISVVASDLRKFSSLADSLKITSKTSSRCQADASSLTDIHPRNTFHFKKVDEHKDGSTKITSVNNPVVSQRKKGKNISVESKSRMGDRRSSPSPTVVSEIGSTEGAVRLTSPLSEIGSECVLARPELNSTLRMSREIQNIREQEFDLSAVIKEKINPKLKTKLEEKAYSKLNADTNMYPDLIGLEVSEADLLGRLADEQLSRVKASDVADKEKAEDKISRIPDVMDFFTCNLHKESASVSVIAVAPMRLEPRTAELDRAFDLYRHIRTWEKL